MAIILYWSDKFIDYLKNINENLKSFDSQVQYQSHMDQVN